MARHGENIRKRKDGRWEARVLCGYKENGKAKYKYIYRKTYAEVKAAKLDFLSRETSYENEKTNHSANKVTFGMLLTEWLDATQMNVKKSTYSRYKLIIDRHIKPELGEILLNQLNNKDLENFKFKKLKQGNLKKSGGLSPKTVMGFLSVIRLALDFGRKKGYIYSNNLIVCNPRQNMPKIQILTEDEQQKLEYLLSEEYNPINFGIMISLYLGLRIGEICALRWEDLDIENGMVCVHRSIQRIPVFQANSDVNVNTDNQAKTKIIIDTPKTACSAREIPIPSFMLSTFKKYQATSSCYVVTGTFEYMEPRIYYRKYKKVMKKCGLQKFNYHALRHTFATRCVENNFDLKSLSEILGHANVSTTLQKYVHPSINLKRQHMDNLEKVSICGQKNSHPN